MCSYTPDVELSSGGQSSAPSVQLLSSEQKHLIHSELLTQVIFDDKGQVIKSKERKLFLLNDTLIYANVKLK